jgi:hypothetical protein
MRIMSIALTLNVAVAVAQVEQPVEPAEVPLVSLIGEDQYLLSELSTRHSDILLQVCGNDMDLAYDMWSEMLGAMEDYSNELDYDLKGIKTYLHVFWNGDGSIAHIAFFPKPNSRNVPIPELRAFFKEFAKVYTLPLTHETGFSHYASGAFPLFYRPEVSAKKD